MTQAPKTEGQTPYSILLTASRYHPWIGGIENSLRHLATTLHEMGNHAVVVCGDATPSGVGRLPARDHVDGIDVHRYRNFGRLANRNLN